MRSGKILAMLAAVFAFTVALKPAFAEKVDACHKTGQGAYHLISVNVNGLSAHLAHGDGRPGDAVPNMSGFIFGPNCTPTTAPPNELSIGCYTLINNPPSVASLDIFYAGPIDILGNVTAFFDSTDGTCSGTAIPDPFDGVISAANATDAQNKCNTLAGAGATIIDLGGSTGFNPSAPGFWFCTTPM